MLGQPVPWRRRLLPTSVTTGTRTLCSMATRTHTARMPACCHMFGDAATHTMPVIQTVTDTGNTPWYVQGRTQVHYNHTIANHWSTLYSTFADLC